MPDKPCNPGDRIRLTAMPNDPLPIPAGTLGTVTFVTFLGHHDGVDHWQVGVKWDIDRSLMLAIPGDEFVVISTVNLFGGLPAHDTSALTCEFALGAMVEALADDALPSLHRVAMVGFAIKVLEAMLHNEGASAVDVLDAALKGARS